MKSTYFLGANSASGFYSLYSGFCSSPGDYLNIIKGGPGTGKSSFMRAIGRAAEARGMDVEYVLCSGAPESLDGVYIPTLRRGWVDGTTPHAIEPERFGLSGSYTDLGQFCALPLENTAGLDTLYSAYKGRYKRAYGYLATAEELRRAFRRPLIPPEELEKLREQTGRIIRRHGGTQAGPGQGSEQRRFYRALSSRGSIRLSEEIWKLCPILYSFEESGELAANALCFAAAEAEDMGLRRIISPCPRAPERFEAVLLPELGLGFISDVFDISDAISVRADAFISKQLWQREKALIREGRRLEKRMEALALAELREANRLHDELERYYISAMDFAALNEFTENTVEEIFA